MNSSIPRNPFSRSIAITVFAMCLSPTTIAPAAMLVLLVVFALHSQTIPIHRLLQAAPFLVFVIVACVQLAVSLDTEGKTFVEIYRWLAISAVILVVPVGHRRAVLTGFYAFFVATVLFSIVQQILPQHPVVTSITSMYVSDVLMDELFMPGFVRSTGFNQGPGHVGLVALIGCLVAPALFAHRRHCHRLVVGTHVAAIAVIVLAAAKGALLAYIAFLVLHMRMRHVLPLLLLAGVLALQSKVFDEDLWMLSRLVQFASGVERFEIWGDLLNAGSQGVFATLFGHGRVGPLASASIFDSDWVFLYLTQGMLGVATVLALILWATRSFGVKLRDSLSIAIVLVLAGLTNPFLTDIKFGAIYWAILLSLARNYRYENLRRHC